MSSGGGKITWEDSNTPSTLSELDVSGQDFASASFERAWVSVVYARVVHCERVRFLISGGGGGGAGTGRRCARVSYVLRHYAPRAAARRLS